MASSFASFLINHADMTDPLATETVFPRLNHGVPLWGWLYIHYPRKSSNAVKRQIRKIRSIDSRGSHQFYVAKSFHNTGKRRYDRTKLLEPVLAQPIRKSIELFLVVWKPSSILVLKEFFSCTSSVKIVFGFAGGWVCDGIAPKNIWPNRAKPIFSPYSLFAFRRNSIELPTSCPTTTTVRTA